MNEPDRDIGIESIVFLLKEFVYYFNNNEERKQLATDIWRECWGPRYNADVRYRIYMFPVEVVPLDENNQPLPAQKVFSDEHSRKLFFLNLFAILTNREIDDSKNFVRIYRANSFRVGNVLVDCLPAERGENGDEWWCMDVTDVNDGVDGAGGARASTGNCVNFLRNLHERVELLESLWLHERVSGLERRMASRL